MEKALNELLRIKQLPYNSPWRIGHPEYSPSRVYLGIVQLPTMDSLVLRFLRGTIFKEKYYMVQAVSCCGGVQYLDYPCVKAHCLLYDTVITSDVLNCELVNEILNPEVINESI